jgi:GLPGLI family protein
MKSILITLAILLTGNLLLAQQKHFITSGTIEYEKSVNLFGLIRQQMGKNPDDFSIQQFEQFKKTQKQFKILKSTLQFDNNKTLFIPVPSEKTRLLYNDNPMATQSNTIYSDLTTGISTAQKEVYDQVFLVKDTMRKIQWKITNETRDIAGYPCRRANAIIMDSVYVVAFYTDKIHIAGGPESFSGLPGMILGVALPHENAQWFATKVTDTSIPLNTIVPPKKGKTANNKQLADILKSAMKSWGANARYELKIFTM